MLEERLNSLAFPQISQTFNFISSGTASTILCPFGLSTLPAMFFDAAETVTARRSDGYECTTTEFAIGDGRGSFE